jgi:hypothetical protein
MSFKQFAFLLTIATATFVVSFDRVVSQPTIASESSSQDNLPDPREGSTPTESPQTDSGTRPGDSQCPEVEIDPIAMMDQSVEVMTGRPDIWFYVPYSPGDISDVKLVIQDENYNYIQKETSFSLSGTPGFVRFEFPNHALPLEFGKTYKWMVTFYCDENNQEDRISLGGNLKRKSPSDMGWEVTHNEIQELPLSEQIHFYVERNLWYDAFQALTRLRLEEPNNPRYKAKWQKLLSDWFKQADSSLPLESLEEQPISSCCSTNTSEARR